MIRWHIASSVDSCSSGLVFREPVQAACASISVLAQHLRLIFASYRLHAATAFVPNTRNITMLYYAAVFLIIALVAGVTGFTGIAGGAASIAQILFFVFLVLFVLSLVFGRRKLA